MAQVLVEAEDDLDDSQRAGHWFERLAVTGRRGGDSCSIEPLKIFQNLPLSIKYHPTSALIVEEEENKRLAASLLIKQQKKNPGTSRSAAVS